MEVKEIGVIMPLLQAPFPYFGGKRRIASTIWERFGNVPNYIEPFFGSGAVLLNRPHEPKIETVNDLDGMIANFWRALKHDPDSVAAWADWPPNEIDLHARHKWLISKKEDLGEQLIADEGYYDSKIAGWWLWGINLWIGKQFCLKANRQIIHLGDLGQGISSFSGRGGIEKKIRHLHKRLRHVRVAYGDWKRITTPVVTHQLGGHDTLTAIFLDPPYSDTNRESVYEFDDFTLGPEILSYCKLNGSNPLLRIALCGYIGEYESLLDYGWTPHYWKALGGYGSHGGGRAKANAKREVVWFSPHCLQTNQLTMF